MEIAREPGSRADEGFAARDAANAVLFSLNGVEKVNTILFRNFWNRVVWVGPNFRCLPLICFFFGSVVNEMVCFCEFLPRASTNCNGNDIAVVTNIRRLFSYGCKYAGGRGRTTIRSPLFSVNSSDRTPARNMSSLHDCSENVLSP
jgi:hypothetical protein